MNEFGLDKFFFSAKSTDIIESVLNNDLRDIFKYCEENELRLNFKKGKTEVVLLGTAQRMKRHGHKIEIIHNGSKVNSVTVYCYLGSIIDQHFSISTNFDRAYKKAVARLRLLSHMYVDI